MEDSKFFFFSPLCLYVFGEGKNCATAATNSILSPRQYIVLFTVTISRFLSLETTFLPPPPPPQHPRCIPFTPSSTHSLFLVRILFINRDRFVSLFRRRRRRRRRGRMLARSRNKVVGGISKAGSDRFVYEIQDEVPSPRLWFVRGHKIIDADRCFCAPMTRCPRKIKAVPWPAN